MKIIATIIINNPNPLLINNIINPRKNEIAAAAPKNVLFMWFVL